LSNSKSIGVVVMPLVTQFAKRSHTISYGTEGLVLTLPWR
jgi:hypothetical protein